MWSHPKVFVDCFREKTSRQFTKVLQEDIYVKQINILHVFEPFKKYVNIISLFFYILKQK